jgi:Mrp family chromosome partitioning ATPase
MQKGGADMSQGRALDTTVLTEIAEMKRLYSALEASLPRGKSGSPVCIAVTSAEPGEGKTTMLAGLAALAAKETGKRVLAMDLNWHAPTLHRLFGAELIDPARAQNGAALTDMVHHVAETPMDVLPALNEQALEPQSNGNEQKLAEKLLDKARAAYDIIFIDTSKIFPTNRRMIDPLVIAQKADGVALVVAAGKTSRQVVKQAQFALETAGATILGVIINDWQNPLS